MDKKKYTVGAIVLVFFIGLGSFLIVNRSRKVKNPVPPTPDQVQPNGSQEVEQPSPPAQVSFIEPQIELKLQQEHTSTLSFSTLPTPPPTAYTLMLSFDPLQIQVSDIKPGNLWTGENILQKEIDNEAGTIKFSVGQGFSDEVSNDTQIAQVTFTSSGSGNSEIQVAEGSVYTSVEEKKLIPMQGLPLTVSVK